MSQIDISQWKEFKVGDILTKVNTAKLKYRTRDLPKKPNGIYELPASTSSVINQGLSVYVPKDKATVLSNCLLVLANGDAGTVFYEPKSFTILQDSYALNLTNDYISHNSMNVYLYLASILTKLFHRHFGWNNKAVWTRAKNLIVKLPVDSNGDPDWQYMDTYIAKLTTFAHIFVSSLKQAKAKPVKLNIDHWGEFKLSELFEPEFTDGDNKVGQLEEDDTGINLIGPLNSNNGILGKFISNTKIFPKNTLTWDMFGTCYWQKEPYQTVSHGHVLVLNPKVQINSASLLYLATILTKFGHQKQFGYTNMLTINKYNKLYIKLPIDEEGEPDWEYMDNQVRHLATLSDLTITSLNPAKLPIFIGEWKEFHLYDLFFLDSGNKLDKRKAQEYDGTEINLIGRSRNNNGIIGQCLQIPNLNLYQAGYLTLPLGGRYLGSCYVQRKPFYTTQNVIVLIPKEEMTANQKQFISSIIFKESQLHYEAFTNELNRHIKTDFKIKLPVNFNGDPDWQYMDQYISWIKQYSKNKLTLIQ